MPDIVQATACTNIPQLAFLFLVCECAAFGLTSNAYCNLLTYLVARVEHFVRACLVCTDITSDSYDQSLDSCIHLCTSIEDMVGCGMRVQ